MGPFSPYGLEPLPNSVVDGRLMALLTSNLVRLEVADVNYFEKINPLVFSRDYFHPKSGGSGTPAHTNISNWKEYARNRSDEFCTH
jgi:hypothetical protein